MSRGPVLILLLWAGLAPRASQAELPASSPPVGPGHTEAAAREQTRRLVREAAQLMDRGEVAGAVAKLEQARRLRPDPSLDYNLGIAYAEGGRPAEAAAALERFLAGAAPGAVSQDRLEEARGRLRALAPTLARLSVRLAPGQEGRSASVLVDNRLLGPVPVVGHWLVPGPHEVRVTAPQMRDFIVSVVLTAGEERSVSALLVPRPDAAAALIPPQAPPAPVPVYRRWWFWTAVSGGAVVAAALIGAGAAGGFNRRAPGSDLDPLDVAR
ncbi:MAG: hypothetical protein RMK29_06055 [Myxococcales bacterium]|nr:hypothetical protein [Myxococcota bacterium]MDW8281254.1 hypothetical protein [Myxococcales bacterium]